MRIIDFPSIVRGHMLDRTKKYLEKFLPSVGRLVGEICLFENRVQGRQLRLSVSSHTDSIALNIC
jgi:hypothetical protein